MRAPGSHGPAQGRHIPGRSPCPAVPFRCEAPSLRPALRRGPRTSPGLLPGQSPRPTSPVPSLCGLGDSRAKSTDGVEVLAPRLCRLTGNRGGSSHHESSGRAPLCRFPRLSTSEPPLRQRRVPRGWCPRSRRTEKEAQRDGSFPFHGHRPRVTQTGEREAAGPVHRAGLAPLWRSQAVAP